MLAQNTFLGTLKYFEIYDEFDGPKCFSVINSLKQLYLVYWAGTGEDDTIDTWLYSSISEKRLDKVRRKEESIRSVFTKPELNVFTVETDYKTGRSSAEFIPRSKLRKFNLPPADFDFDSEYIEVCSNEIDWYFEIKIQKRSDTHAFPDRTMVTTVIDAFSEVIECLMLDESREIPKVYPKSAVPGSFEVKLSTSDDGKASQAIKSFETIISEVDKLDENLKSSVLDPYRLKELLEIIEQHKLKVTITPRTYQHLTSSIQLDTRKFDELIDKLNETTTVLIDSIKVPQANNLERVIKIVEMRANGEKLSHENIEGINSKRQVKYHTDAAYCLGLLKKNLSITSAGRFLASKTDKKARLEFLADRFESSDFGWGWMKWSGVKTMRELNPSTASAFIEECVAGLNEKTSRRRSSTLTKWLQILNPYRRDYAKQKIEVSDSESNQTAE